jgi:uncharacterized repeat protein (TIGR01451 family)
MKKLITLCLLLFLTLSNKFEAQIQSIQIYDSIHSCSQEKSIYSWITIGAQTDQFSISIDWGDGQVEETNNQIYNPNQTHSTVFSHDYTNIGNYTVQLSAVSSVSGNTITSSPLQISVFEAGYCGYLYPYTQGISICDVGFVNFQAAVYDLIGADGSVSSFTGFVSNLNINNAPYTIQLNSDWLLNNNLTYNGNPIQILSFDPIYGFPIINGELLFQVSSNTVQTNPDYSIDFPWGFGISGQEKAMLYFQIFDLSCSSNPTTQIQITYPNFLVPNVDNLTNASIVGNVLYFDHEIYNYWPTIYFYMPGTTSAGTFLDFTIQVNDLTGLETNLSNNIVNYSAIVYNSYDPNDKLVNKAENINPMEQEELTYTINFQNEGNADALKVVVKDTLSDNLDLSTFEVIRTKHNVVTSVNPTTREVKFTFNDIYLAPKELDEEGSKGYIVYKIKEKVNLPINSEIKNTAYIYFDFNPAIITNTTLNRNTLLSVSEIIENELLTLYPNPVKDKLQIKSTEDIKSIVIYSTNGVKVMENNQTTSIDVSKLVNGVYFVEVLTDSSLRKEKIVVQH